MNCIPFLLACLFAAINITAHTDEMDCISCTPIQDIIAKETQEIAALHPANHNELSELYVTRGESYLLDAQYEKAVEDFQNAQFHLEQAHDSDEAMIIAFRAAFGEVISYDNLEMHENTQTALEQLQTVFTHLSCYDCTNTLTHQETTFSTKSDFRETIKPVMSAAYPINNQLYRIKQKGSDKVLGPDQPPTPRWCEEIVTGVGRAMDAIACLAPNYAVKVILIGIIETLMTRGVKCCEAGGFWKTCVAPISTKWRLWKNNKEKNIIPNEQNLPLYTN